VENGARGCGEELEPALRQFKVRLSAPNTPLVTQQHGVVQMAVNQKIGHRVEGWVLLVYTRGRAIWDGALNALSQGVQDICLAQTSCSLFHRW
jgi:hypothetical protein